VTINIKHAERENINATLSLENNPHENMHRQESRSASRATETFSPR